jgi:transcription elongation factor SPT5
LRKTTKIGAERDLIVSLSLKAAMKAAADNGSELSIISAFQRDSIKGIIYVEAFSENDVRDSLDGIFGIYVRSEKGLFLIDIDEMPDLLKTRQRKVELQVGGWVRFKRGKYAGDLAQVVEVTDNGEEMTLKYVPRIDVTPKDEGADGRKRKKGFGGGSALNRPPPKFFNPEEIKKVYGSKEVTKRQGIYLAFRGDEFANGFLEKEHKMASLNVTGVQPTLDELTLFGVGKEGGLGSDLAAAAEAIRLSDKSILQPGDHVEIFEGGESGIFGTITSILNDKVSIKPSAQLDLDGKILETYSKNVRKRFREGDHVKVMSGTDKDDTGLVVRVLDESLTFLSDLSLTEVTVFSKNVREAAEVGSGVNNIGQYQLHDLVQLECVISFLDLLYSSIVDASSKTVTLQLE